MDATIKYCIQAKSKSSKGLGFGSVAECMLGSSILDIHYKSREQKFGTGKMVQRIKALDALLEV